MASITVFERPQWQLRRDEKRLYGYADNSVTIEQWRYDTMIKHIVVPASFFTMLESLLPAKILKVAREKGVCFYLEEDADGSFGFGFEVNVTEEFRTLWSYPKGKVPGWLLKRK